jgi:hypothetical protein
MHRVIMARSIGSISGPGRDLDRGVNAKKLRQPLVDQPGNSVGESKFLSAMRAGVDGILTLPRHQRVGQDCNTSPGARGYSPLER